MFSQYVFRDIQVTIDRVLINMRSRINSALLLYRSRMERGQRAGKRTRCPASIVKEGSGAFGGRSLSCTFPEVSTRVHSYIHAYTGRNYWTLYRIKLTRVLFNARAACSRISIYLHRNYFFRRQFFSLFSSTICFALMCSSRYSAATNAFIFLPVLTEFSVLLFIFLHLSLSKSCTINF